MATAYNEQTGETLELQGGEWVPIANPDVPTATPETFTGGAPAAQETSFNPLDKEFAGVTWPGNGPLDMLGAFNPAFGGSLGVAAGAQNIRALRNAPMIDPIAKAMEQAEGLVSGVVKEFTPTAGGPVKEALLTLGEKIPGIIGTAASRTKSAAVNKSTGQLVRQMGSEGERARKGLLNSSEFAQQLGIDEGLLSDATKNSLNYLQRDAQTLTGPIQTARKLEQEALYTGAADPRLMENLQAVKTAYTNKVIADAGIPGGFVPDPAVVSEYRRAAGQQIGQALQDNFPDDVVKLLPDQSFAQVIGANTKDEAAPTLKLLKNYGAVKGEGDEIVDASDMSLHNYQRLRTELEKLISATKNQGIKQTAESVLSRLDATAYEGMDDAGKEALGQARYQYKILSKLQEPGVIKDGQIDPGAFQRHWTRGESKNMRQFDDLARLSDTARDVLMTASPGTTGKRTIEAVGDAAVGAIANTFLPGMR